MRSAVLANYINVVFTGVATLAESRTVFTQSAVRTDICTIAAHTAVGAKGGTLAADCITVRAQAHTVAANNFANLTYVYTVAAVSAQFACQFCVIFANVATGTKINTALIAIRAVIVRAEDGTFGTSLTVVAPLIYASDTYVAIFASPFVEAA